MKLLISFLCITGTHSSDRNSTLHGLYFEAAFEKSKDYAGYYLRLPQIPLANTSFVRNYYYVRRESSAFNISTAQSQLRKDGYCILDLSHLGYSSHYDLYEDVKKNMSKIAKVINERNIIKDTTIEIRGVSRIKDEANTLSGLHRDNIYEDEIFSLWIPGRTNKYFMVVPNSSFSSKRRAIEFLRLKDAEIIKEHLQQYARIADPGTIVVFRSCSKTNPFKSCIHAGVIDGNAEQTQLIDDDPKTQSVIVDLKIV